MSQKSILEQALLQVQTLEEAVKQNAKGILASTMKQGLNDLLKEQEEEDDAPSIPGEEDDVPANDTGDDEPSINDDPSADDTDDDDSIGGENPFEPTGEDDDEDDDDTLDMTGASHDEVLKVFKAMKDDDGIIVKKDGNKIELSDGENDYIIKLDGDDDDDTDGEEGDEDGDEIGDPLSENAGTLGGPGFKKEEPVYEITLDEEEDDEDMNEEDDVEETEPTEDIQKGFKPKKDNVYTKKVGKQQDAVEGIEDGFKPKKDGVYTKKVAKQQDAVEGIEDGFKPKKDGVYTKKVGKQQDAVEAARTIGNGVKPPAQKMKFKAGRPEINEELEILKKQNAQYKQALNLFKDKINEVAVFNANLTFATRLFTEHSTTKQEKLDILKRFDTLSTIEESKNLYTQIKTELDTKKPVTETVLNKISSTPTTSSTEVLAESKAYENPQFKRMKELMAKLK